MKATCDNCHTPKFGLARQHFLKNTFCSTKCKLEFIEKWKAQMREYIKNYPLIRPG